MMRMCDLLFAELSEPSLPVSGGIPRSLKLETSEKKLEPSLQTARPTALTNITTRPTAIFILLILQASDLRKRLNIRLINDAFAL